MTTPETPVQGRESARALGCRITGCDQEEPLSTHWPSCDHLTAAIETRDRARDAAAEARERTLREALEEVARAGVLVQAGFGDAGKTLAKFCFVCGVEYEAGENCDNPQCSSFVARLALAAVEALKQGGL